MALSWKERSWQDKSSVYAAEYCWIQEAVEHSVCSELKAFTEGQVAFFHDNLRAEGVSWGQDIWELTELQWSEWYIIAMNRFNIIPQKNNT